MRPSNPTTDALRLATAQAHRRLDHLPVLHALLKPSLAIGTYAAVLAAMHPLQHALEERVLKSPLWDHAVFPPRLPDITRDLALLGGQPSALVVEPLRADTPAQQVGLMYVLEGSRLGASVIGTRLLEHHPTWPRHFYRVEDPWPRWLRFAQTAHAQCQDGGIGLAVEAALSVFACFQTQLEAVGRYDGAPNDACTTHVP